MADVIDFPTSGGTSNLSCGICESQWLAVQAIVINAETMSASGYALPITCHECGATFNSPEGGWTPGSGPARPVPLHVLPADPEAGGDRG